MTGRMAKRPKSSTGGHYWQIEKGTPRTRERGNMFDLDCCILFQSWYALGVMWFLARTLICTQSCMGTIRY